MLQSDDQPLADSPRPRTEARDRADRAVKHLLQFAGLVVIAVAAVVVGSIFAFLIRQDPLSTNKAGDLWLTFSGLKSCRTGSCAKPELALDVSSCRSAGGAFWVAALASTCSIVFGVDVLGKWFSGAATSNRASAVSLASAGLAAVSVSIAIAYWNRCVSAAEAFAEQDLFLTGNWAGCVWFGFTPLVLGVLTMCAKCGQRVVRRRQELLLLLQEQQA